MAQRTPAQLARRRRVESAIGVVAPLLDVLLFAGERLSRVAGRNAIDPELAAQLSLRVTRAVMPDFFFHERGEH